MSSPDLKDCFIPGLMVTQTVPESQRRDGVVAETLKNALAEGFFDAFQTLDLPNRGDRQAVGKLMRGSGRYYNYCLGRRIYSEQWNLSALDKAGRDRAVDAVRECADEAVEAGASALQVMSGPAPEDPALRGEALLCFGESLARILVAVSRQTSMTLLVEPLDHGVHKRFTLGTAREVAAIMESLGPSAAGAGIILDTAHCRLNGEDWAAALEACRPWLHEVHLANCVDTPGHPLHGDRHIGFGPPGFLDAETAGMLLGFAKAGMKQGIPRRVCLFAERLREEDESAGDMRAACRDFLEQAWRHALLAPDGEYS